MNKRIANLRRRVSRARSFPANTCPASRHLHIMADTLLMPQPKSRGGPTALRYPPFEEEPEYCAESILLVLESLWKLRTKAGKVG